MSTNNPILLQNRSGTKMFIHDGQVFESSKRWVGSLRIKLITRSSAGERVVFIGGRRVKTIIDQINNKIKPTDSYVALNVVLADRNGRHILEKSINLKTSKITLASFLDAAMVKSFLKYNIGLSR